MKRFLITTALEETWRDDEPVLFIGEWCRLHDRKERWDSMPAEVLPYHADDRARLYGDYQYLQSVCERLLLDLRAQLNRIHEVDHSVRYWRILVGPWLGYFAQILLDRWTSIQQAASRYELSGTIVLTGHEGTLIPNDMADFIQMFVTDEWNHTLYAAILQKFSDVPCTPLARQVKQKLPSKKQAVSSGRRLKATLKIGYARIASLFMRNRDAFFLSTYLPLKEEIRLQLRLGQVPHRWRFEPPVLAAADMAQRGWTLNEEGSSGFEACLRVLISLHIPTAYLEGYGKLVEQANGLPWPKEPSVIWTSNAANSDDVFKAWAAGKVERGVPLVIGQHGGHYGAGLWSFIEDHEIAIGEKYLSWGWTRDESPEVVPLGQLKAQYPVGVSHAEQPGLLLVTTTVPRYSYFMFSAMASSQWLGYFDDQSRFVKALPESIRTALTVRLYSQDYGWSQARRWRERFPDVRLDTAPSIRDQIRRCRLYISTYNATTFLESFTMNVPTVMYWNPSHWELRAAAVPYFDELKRVGIFHESPESAARHVAQVWDDVDAWWSAPDVRAVLERFKDRFCRMPDNLLDRVEQTLRQVMAESQKSAAQ